MVERRRLLEVLEGAQAIGLIGPGALAAHADHARAWAAVLGDAPESFLDLGSGGGVPGLLLATIWPATRATLLDARARSAEWLEGAIGRLGLVSRVVVVCARAEAAGRAPGLRETFPLVVARGFGAPAVTAECGSPFVVPGGRLSVSEPPGGDPDRWPAEPLAQLGLRFRRDGTEVGDGASFVVLDKVEALDDRWPRRDGKPGKRPLWS